MSNEILIALFSLLGTLVGSGGGINKYKRAHLLKSFRANIASWVKPGAHLALAGILEEEFDSVVSAYEGLGFELVEAETLKEWRSGLFRKK